MVARAKTRATFDGALNKLREKKPEAARYLEEAEPETWATALFVGQRYGHDTSNVAESLNQVIKLDRELAIIKLLDALWHRVMAKRAERLATALKALGEGRLMTPFVEGKLTKGRLWARQNTVQPSSPSQARVQQPDNRVMLVDLEAGTCSCLRYQENGIPCGHAMTFIFAKGQDLGSYLPQGLSLEVWRASYEAPIPPIDISELAAGHGLPPCFPPATRVPRGRPKKERVRREDARRPRGRQEYRDHGGLLPLGAVVADIPDMVRSRCSTCGQPGHNARRCRQPHE